MRHATVAALTAAAALIAVLLTPVSGQEGPATPPNPGRISQLEFKGLLTVGGVVVVDVREESEYARGHIPGAVLLPLRGLLQEPQRHANTIARLRKSPRAVVTYCACDGEISSLRVAALLQERGIAGARALTGGWNDWLNDGNRVETGR